MVVVVVVEEALAVWKLGSTLGFIPGWLRNSVNADDLADTKDPWEGYAEQLGLGSSDTLVFMDEPLEEYGEQLGLVSREDIVVIVVVVIVIFKASL